MRRRLLSLLFPVVLTAAAALAQFGSNSQPGVKLNGRSFTDLYSAQKILLSNYCRLDFEGVRLQPAGWTRFKPFTSLHVNPEFTRVVVVTRFDIETPEQPSEILSAHYQTVGFYQESDGYTALSSTARVTFRMQEQNGNLLVTGISSETPYVSPRAAVAWMNLRLSDPNANDMERAQLKDAVDHLNKFLPQAHTATITTNP